MGIESFSTFGLWGRHAVFDIALDARYEHRRLVAPARWRLQ
jgi:hypothetical protein